MPFAIKDTLTEKEVQSGLRAVIRDGLASEAMVTFTGGAFLIALYSIHRLAKVREVREVKEEIVIHELASEIRRPRRNLSTAGGLRQMVVFPVSLVRRVPGVDHLTGQKSKTQMQ